jgi:hypothetical protein
MTEAMIEAASRAYCRNQGLQQDPWIVVLDRPDGTREWAGHNEPDRIKDGERAIQLWDWFGRRHAEVMLAAIAPFLSSGSQLADAHSKSDPLPEPDKGEQHDDR